MKLAYSTNGFTRVDLVTAIRQVAQHGYTAVELLADAPHWAPASHGGIDAKLVRRVLESTGLDVSNVNANTAAVLWPNPPAEAVFEPALSNHDPAVRRRRIEYTRECFAFAAEVGAPAVSVTSGRTEADHPPEEGMAWFAESLAELCELGASYGINVGVEYEPGLLVETADEVRALIDKVGHPALGANLDMGHAICAGEDPLESMATLAGRIWNVHLEDIRGTKHYHLVPGEGDVDFARILGGLQAVGYTGFLTVELYTCAARADAAAAAAYAVLAQHLRRLEGDPGSEHTLKRETH